LYIDGIDVTVPFCGAPTPACAALTPATNTLNFGINTGANSNDWNGDLDDFATYNSPCTFDDVKDLYGFWRRKKNGLLAWDKTRTCETVYVNGVYQCITLVP
jgi:hypothetical protein